LIFLSIEQYDNIYTSEDLEFDIAATAEQYVTS